LAVPLFFGEVFFVFLGDGWWSSMSVPMSEEERLALMSPSLSEEGDEYEAGLAGMLAARVGLGWWLRGERLIEVERT
jgi:hypothetical protein